MATLGMNAPPPPKMEKPPDSWLGRGWRGVGKRASCGLRGVCAIRLPPSSPSPPFFNFNLESSLDNRQMILLVSPKHVYATKRLIQEAAKAGAELEALDILELAKRQFKVDLNKYQTLFARQAYPYFQQIVRLAKDFKKFGKRVVDERIAEGDLGYGKMQNYATLKRAGLPIPKTRRLSNVGRRKNIFPCIIKWDYGFKGREVFLVRNQRQLANIEGKFLKKELLVQEFIPADYEYKVITVGYKSLPVVLRFAINPKTFRPDFANYRVIHRPTANPSAARAVRLAEKSARILRRELAKVDLLEKDRKLYILEVNRWPGLKSFEEQTHYNAAGDFVAYLKEIQSLPGRPK